MSRLADILERLQTVIAARKGGDHAASYTAQLLAGGPPASSLAV